MAHHKDIEQTNPPIDGALWSSLATTEAELVQAEAAGNEARVAALSHRLTGLILDLVERVHTRCGRKVQS